MSENRASVSIESNILQSETASRPTNDDVPVNTSTNDTASSVTPSDTAAANQDTSVREIYKNSWLKQIPCTDKWTGRLYKSQKAEKFWVVFCVHDDKEAFLEFYENRRSAYSHCPLSSASLSQCLHISPTIVAQESDHEFVVTLETQVIRLAASTKEQMDEWMDTMRNKLRELGVLEPKDNLYSKEPAVGPKTPVSESRNSVDFQSQEGSHSSHSSPSIDQIRHSSRDPNSPLPPVPAVIAQTDNRRDSTSSSTAVVYIRNPSVPVISRISQPSVTTTQVTGITSTTTQGMSVTSSSADTSNTVQSIAVPIELVSSMRSQLRSEDSISDIISSTANTQLPSSQSVPNTPALSNSNSDVYEPLFCPMNHIPASIAIRNPNYENPPEPQTSSAAEVAPVLPPKQSNERKLQSSAGNDALLGISKSRNLRHVTSCSEPSLNSSIEAGPSTSDHVNHRLSADETNVRNNSGSSAAASNRVLLRQVSDHGVSTRTSDSSAQPHSSPTNIPLSPNSRQRNSSSSNENQFPTDENGRPLSLREAQVLKLQNEIVHKSGVRFVLRKKDCINAIAFVEGYGTLWIAGWKQKEHPLLHNTFHIGDRVLVISGFRINNIQDALKAIKQQHTIVEFIVRRTPYGKVLAIKREYEGQDLGIVREGGTSEIKEVRQGGLALRHGLPPKAPSLDSNSPMCNWYLTEVNHRPLNLFFKDNEVQDRLNAVGLDISILVQPADFVKILKKQLKTLRGYKDYTLQ